MLKRFIGCCLVALLPASASAICNIGSGANAGEGCGLGTVEECFAMDVWSYDCSRCPVTHNTPVHLLACPTPVLGAEELPILFPFNAAEMQQFADEVEGSHEACKAHWVASVLNRRIEQEFYGLVDPK